MGRAGDLGMTVQWLDSGNDGLPFTMNLYGVSFMSGPVRRNQECTNTDTFPVLEELTSNEAVSMKQISLLDNIWTCAFFL